MGVISGWRSGFGEIPNADLVASVFSENKTSGHTECDSGGELYNQARTLSYEFQNDAPFYNSPPLSM
jgi:hypothetical protein